jgi:AraC-like DNA-binding protein
MPETLRGIDANRLERSCGRRPDSIRFGSGAPGLERAELFLSSCHFEPHRHDTYAIGITTAGVQTFQYRGERRICLPGQLHVLHPDELHDGGAGTADGFGYRIVYVAPELVAEALDGELPFVTDPVHERPGAVADVLADIDEPLGEMGQASAVTALADALRSLGGRPARTGPLDRRSVELVRDYLAVHACEQTPASTLERIAGADRFTIARQFRQAFGTSPDRYRTMRRLEVARTAIAAGTPLARAAADAGFADQSHLTRQFRRAYGLTPARFARAVGTR